MIRPNEHIVSTKLVLFFSYTEATPVEPIDLATSFIHKQLNCYYQSLKMKCHSRTHKPTVLYTYKNMDKWKNKMQKPVTGILFENVSVQVISVARFSYQL